MKRKVYPAEPYSPGALHSMGNAKGMLIKQYQFPYEYNEEDKLLRADDDRCMMWDYEHVRRCFEKHDVGGELNLYCWFLAASNEKIMNFLKDILGVDRKVEWTGFRILGTVAGNGHTIFSFELFAKHSKSDTVVYSDINAPNVLPSRRGNH